ncbi:MAG: aminodeoxychorismate/anthranilate synthase component II [Spirochaetaceae bacterium]|jgi:anthranilate synthase component 2|nr:aminodeoxychorismate/anthranilate synthase component II [Spirochaetaceae bacterium]
MIVLIDNYDSFSYNLFQMLGGILLQSNDGAASVSAADRSAQAIVVKRNDEVTCAEIERLAPSHIVLSPGPGRPSDAGVCEQVIRTFAGKIPILGVCLGHQAICEVYGAAVTYAARLMHGKASRIRLDTSCPLFAGLPPEIDAARYHSLAADPETIPPALIVTAWTAENEVMAIRHRDYPVFGVQFHPESILTPLGKTILSNFLVNVT